LLFKQKALLAEIMFFQGRNANIHVYKETPHHCVSALQRSFSSNSSVLKLEIHTGFFYFSSLDLTKNLSLNLLAELCGATIKKRRTTHGTL